MVSESDLASTLHPRSASPLPLLLSLPLSPTTPLTPPSPIPARAIPLSLPPSRHHWSGYTSPLVTRSLRCVDRLLRRATSDHQHPLQPRTHPLPSPLLPSLPSSHARSTPQHNQHTLAFGTQDVSRVRKGGLEGEAVAGGED